MPEALDHIRKLNELIKDVKFAMLTTASADGTLHSRPMATQEMDEQGNLWFFTRLHSTKVVETQSERHVNVSYAEPDDTRYVSVSGTVEVVQDPIKSQELWNPMYKAWFPQGLDDPELTLLKIHVTEAEYWDTPSGKMVQLAGFLKAVTTGKTYKASEDEHAKLDFETGQKISDSGRKIA